MRIPTMVEDPTLRRPSASPVSQLHVQTGCPLRSANQARALCCQCTTARAAPHHLAKVESASGFLADFTTTALRRECARARVAVSACARVRARTRARGIAARAHSARMGARSAHVVSPHDVKAQHDLTRLGGRS